MRVGMIRQDLVRLSIDDIENTSQRAFSSAPPGQSRCIEYPSNAVLTSVLNEYAYLSVLGNGASYPVTLVSGTNNVLSIKTASTASYTAITIPAAGGGGTSYTAAQIVAVLNPAFINAGLLCVASVQGGQIQIDTVAPSSPYAPSYASAYLASSPPSGLPEEFPTVNPINSGPTAYLAINADATSTINVTIGISVGGAANALSGLPVSVNNLAGTSLKGGLYQYTAIAGQSGTTAAVASLGSNGTAVITGLTGMTANSVLHVLTFSNGTSGGNNGTFQIVQYLSATSVVIANTAAVAPDAGGAVLHWAEKTVSFNISNTQIGGLSTFQYMEGYSATLANCTGSFLALMNAIQGAIAPGLVETGPVLLSFAKGKLSKMLSSTFQPGSPSTTTESRLGYAAGPAVFITTDDGHTSFSI